MPSFVAGGCLRRVEWPCGMASLLPRLISSLVLSLVLPRETLENIPFDLSLRWT